MFHSLFEDCESTRHVLIRKKMNPAPAKDCTCSSASLASNGTNHHATAAEPMNILLWVGSLKHFTISSGQGHWKCAGRSSHIQFLLFVCNILCIWTVHLFESVVCGIFFLTHPRRESEMHCIHLETSIRSIFRSAHWKSNSLLTSDGVFSTVYCLLQWTIVMSFYKAKYI